MLRFEKIRNGESRIIIETGILDEIEINNEYIKKIIKNREIEIKKDYPCHFYKFDLKIIDNEIIEQVLKNRKIELPTQKFPFRIFRDEPTDCYDSSEVKVEEHDNLCSNLEINVENKKLRLKKIRIRKNKRRKDNTFTKN